MECCGLWEGEGGGVAARIVNLWCLVPLGWYGCGVGAVWVRGKIEEVSGGPMDYLWNLGKQEQKGTLKSYSAGHEVDWTGIGRPASRHWNLVMRTEKRF